MSSIEPAPVSYISVPTLKNIAAVHVAIALNTSSLVDYLRGEYKPVGRERFRIYSRFSAAIEEITSTLPLPTSLKADVASIFLPIVRERCKIMPMIKGPGFAGSLHWTNEGTVDRKKTVEQFIMKGSRFSMKRLLCLSSEYCIETLFPEIYDRLQKKERNDYLLSLSHLCRNKRLLLAYWISIVKGELPELLRTIKRYNWKVGSKRTINSSQSIYQIMFTFMVLLGNPIAVQYFWEKLTDEEKYSNILEWVKMAALRMERFSSLKRTSYTYQETDNHSDVLFFLLSQISDGKQQREIFRMNSLPILYSLFIHWPRQRFLLPTLQMMWDYLDEKLYLTFMTLVVDNIVEGFGTETILREIWNASPTRFRKCFIDYVLHSGTENSTDIWCNLLLVKDMTAIQMLLEEMDSDDRRRVPFSVIRNRKLLLVIYTDKLDLFETLVQNSATSESDVLAIKKGVVDQHGGYLCLQWICDDNLESIKKFFSWAFIFQHQTDEIKREIIREMKIVHQVVCQKANFELANKFLNWCFDSPKKVDEFKKRFALLECEIDKIGECYYKWEAINPFHTLLINLRRSNNVGSVARRIKLEFEFVANFIHWCFDSEEDSKEYKRKFVLSPICLEKLRMILGYSRLKNELREFEILEKEFLTILFPLDEGVIAELIEKIRNPPFFNPLSGVKDLFLMIDDANDYARHENSIDSRRKMRNRLVAKKQSRGVLD